MITALMRFRSISFLVFASSVFLALEFAFFFRNSSHRRKANGLGRVAAMQSLLFAGNDTVRTPTELQPSAVVLDRKNLTSIFTPDAWNSSTTTNITSPHEIPNISNIQEENTKLMSSEDTELTKDDIFIGINVGLREKDLAEAIMMTWGRDLPNGVGFYSCPQFSADITSLHRDSEYPCSEYPPIRSWTVTIKNMAKYRRAKWYLKCDVDTYVNVPELLKFFQHLHRKGLNPDTPYYFGSVGYGRKHEKHMLGLNGRPFVMGGPCVGISAGAMRAVAPILDTCMRAHAPRLHSDTQLARCFLQLNITPGLPVVSERRLRSNFRQYYSRVAASSHDGKTVAPFAGSTVPAVLRAGDTDPPAVTMHSIKERLLMYRVHSQLRLHTRPIDPAGNRTDVAKRLPCAHNPQMVRAVTSCRGMGFSPYWTDASEYHYRAYSVVDRCSVRVPECPAAPLPAWRGGTAATIGMAYIVCLNPAACRYGALYRELVRLGIPVEICPAVSWRAGNISDFASPTLTPGEMAVRASFARAFRRALAAGHKAVMVFEEDALLHRNFSAELDRVLSCPRCACHLAPTAASGCTPGITWLGMTVWSPAILKEYDRELERLNDPHTCVNVLPSTYGAFGAVYSAEVLPYLLLWLDSQNLFPLDWAHTFLSMEGFVMRGLRRPIVIASLSHNSTVKARSHQGSSRTRYKLHDWDLRQFRPPAPSPPAAVVVN